MLLIAVGLIIARMVPLFLLMQTRIDTVNRVLREQLTGIRVIRAFVREDVESVRFGKANVDVTDTALQAGRLMALMFPVVMLVLNVSSVAVIWFGAFRIEDGSMQVGTLVAFLSYLMQILMAVMMATFMAVMIPRATVSADRIGEVLETDSSVRPPLHPVVDSIGRGEVELVDVGFAYPGAEQPVLSDVSFTVHQGQTTAIIGSTGSGKTTLVNLLPRLFDATNGSVRVDGVDVRELHPDLLWGSIGLVPQKPHLFSGTVRSNLLYGKPDATEAELWEALTIAQARDFVAEMPDGLDAPIAQGGMNVSGGQRQRLAIARALVKRPELYIFDDSFSSLDLATDARLREALAVGTGGATMVIVAQPPPAALLRHGAARRGAQPGHQRRGQRLTEPAAVAEPGRHLSAHRGGRHRDDVPALASPGPDRPGHSAADPGHDRPDRPALAEVVRRPVDPHRRAERPD